MTTIGVDAHKRNHTLVAVDSAGRQTGEKVVDSTSTGHAEGIVWAVERFGWDLEWAVEDNRAATALLEQDLMAASTWPVSYAHLTLPTIA